VGIDAMEQPEVLGQINTDGLHRHLDSLPLPFIIVNRRCLFEGMLEGWVHSITYGGSIAVEMTLGEAPAQVTLCGPETSLYPQTVLLCCRCGQAPFRMLFSPPYFEPWVTLPLPVWRLPLALGPNVSHHRLSVRARMPVTRFSRRLSTRGGRPVGGAPLSSPAFWQGPDGLRTASTRPIPDV
jgi:hypothetical protein